MLKLLPLLAPVGMSFIGPIGTDAPVFSWNADNEAPTGIFSSFQPDFGATRSTADPIDGTHSFLTANQGFSQYQVYNWVQGRRAWAPTTRGRVFLKFRYPTSWTVAAMIFQMDGKAPTGETWGSNEGLSIITASTGSPSRKTITVGILGTTITLTGIDLLAATIYSMEVWYDKDCTIDGFKSLKVFINGIELGYSDRALDAAVTAEWYHLSLGNDKNAQFVFQFDAVMIWNNIPTYVPPAPNVLLSEGFELGTLPSGWVAQSSNLNYNYSPAISGSKSCRMAFNAVAYCPFGANCDFVEARFRLRIETLPTSTASVVELRTADDATLLAGFGIFSSGSVGVRGTTNSTNSVGTLSLLTDYYAFLSYQGSVLSHVSFSTTPTRPRTGNNYVGLQLGPAAAQVGRITLRRSQGIVCVLDDLYVTSTPIA